MALTVTQAATAVWTTTAGNKTLTATPALNDLIVVVAASSGQTGGTTAVTDSNSDGLGTYVQVDTDRTGFSTTGVLTVWVRSALIGSATSTVFTAAQASSTGGGLDVYRVAGTTLVGAAAVRSAGGQSTGTAATTPAPVLSATPLSGSAIITAVANGTSPAGVTARTGYTRPTTLGYATPTTGLAAAFLATGETTATITWGSTSASAFASVAVEIAPTPEAGPALELSGYGDWTGVAGDATINYVEVSVTHSESSATVAAPTVQLWDGATAQIGATQTCTASASSHTDIFQVSGATYAQLSRLRVRFSPNGQPAEATHLDSICLAVNTAGGSALGPEPDLIMAPLAGG